MVNRAAIANAIHFLLMTGEFTVFWCRLFTHVINKPESSLFFFPCIPFGIDREFFFVRRDETHIQRIAISNAIGAMLELLRCRRVFLYRNRYLKRTYRCFFSDDALPDPRPFSIFSLGAVDPAPNLLNFFN